MGKVLFLLCLIGSISSATVLYVEKELGKILETAGCNCKLVDKLYYRCEEGRQTEITISIGTWNTVYFKCGDEHRKFRVPPNRVIADEY